MALVLTNRRLRWSDALDRGPTAIVDGQRLYRVTAEVDPEYLGSTNRALGGSLRAAHAGRSWARRFALEASVQHYDEARALAGLLERKGGSRVSLWLSAWPERHREEAVLTASPWVLSVDNTGPMVWPVIVAKATNQVDSLSLEWRSWNLLLNSGGEEDSSGAPVEWTASGTPTWEPFITRSGWRAFRVTSAAQYYQDVPVEPEQRYVAAAEIYAPVGATHGSLLKVEWRDAAGTPISTDSTTFILAEEFQRVSHFATAPANAATARVYLSTDQAAEIIYDEVLFGPVGVDDTEPPPYEEGVSYTWSLGEAIPAGSVLQVGMRERHAMLDGAEAALSADTQWWWMPTGWQTLRVTAAGTPSLDMEMHLVLDWTTLCQILTMPEGEQAFQSPLGGWERYGRHVSIELEEIL